MGVSTEAVRAEFRKIPKAKTTFSENETEPAEADAEMARPTDKEFWLLKLLLLYDDLISWTALHLDLNWILHPLARKIVEQRLNAQKNESWKSLGAFLDACDSNEMRNLVTEAVAEERKIPNPEQQLSDVTLKLRNQFLDRQIAALTRRQVSQKFPKWKNLNYCTEQQKMRETETLAAFAIEKLKGRNPHRTAPLVLTVKITSRPGQSTRGSVRSGRP